MITIKQNHDWIFGTFSLWLLLSQPVSAVSLPLTATTEGRVTFTERGNGGDGSITVPETAPPVIVKPVDPHPSMPAGPLMILEAPTFDFGTVEIASKNMLYSAKTVPYNQINEEGSLVPKKSYFPPFLQVEDVRGNTLTQSWALTVAATPFKSSSQELIGAEIRIQRPSLIFNNSVIDERNPEGISTPAAGYSISTTAKEILTTEPGKGNALTSLVMDTEYLEGKKVDGSSYTADDKIDDVQLYVPVTAYKEKGQIYQSTITWSLYNTPETVAVSSN